MCINEGWTVGVEDGLFDGIEEGYTMCGTLVGDWGAFVGRELGLLDGKLVGWPFG